MSRYRNLIPVCCAAALTLGLAACSSSSNTATDGGTELTPVEQQLAMLQQEISALRAQLGITDADDIGDSIDDLMDERDRLQMQINDAKEDEERKAAEAAAKATAATAAKLYAGISTPTGDVTSPTDGDRAAAYNDAGTAILVSSDPDTTADGYTGPAITLSEDKKTMVAALHGWQGKRYADPAGGDMYEAMVYSNVEAPKMGRKFGSAAAVTNTGAYEYQLTEGALPASFFVAANVAFTGVTRTAGTEMFKLPDPNPGGATVINIPGSYHGVSGTYNCTPSTPASGCSAAVAAKGFTVSSGDTWTFTPANAMARVRDAADTAYASYGWWIKKADKDGPFTASVFADEKGNLTAVTGITALNGTATYRGGAAGKYALSSTTGGTNDAGHFTARATLEADFTNNATETAITGTIDNFIGADGQSRDWEVKLNGSQISNAGAIGNASASTGVDTVWTIGETAATKSGNWTGNLLNNGDDGVPQVATGTFYTEYGRAGRMVGAFGANKQ